MQLYMVIFDDRDLERRKKSLLWSCSRDMKKACSVMKQKPTNQPTHLFLLQKNKNFHTSVLSQLDDASGEKKELFPLQCVSDFRGL